MATLSAEHITKHFGSTVANNDVSLEVHSGEILAVLGENGAGKSTLMSVIAGLLVPDRGTVKVGGRALPPGRPDLALEAGIGMIHQHFMLVSRMTVLENIILGREPRTWTGRIDWAKAASGVRELLERFRLQVDLNAPLESLTVGQRQRVEIVKAFYRGAKFLILDEPTALLTPQEAGDLFAALKRFASQGMGIVFISHKLGEVREIAERVLVMRDGEVAGHASTASASADDLAEMMVGRKVVLRVEREPVERGQKQLRVTDLVVQGANGLTVGPLSFSTRAGEILAIAGVDGNGQRQLSDALVGLTQLDGGSIHLGDRRLDNLPVQARLRAGLSHVPADRQEEGLVLNLSLWENFILRDYSSPRYKRGAGINKAAARAAASEWMKRLDVRPPDPGLKAAQLSGGNQQKLLLAREFSRDPVVLVVSQPTRGLDVGAVEFIHNELLALRSQGRSVVLISLELDEILTLADRIMVLYEGRSMGLVENGQVDRTALGLMMAGKPREEITVDR